MLGPNHAGTEPVKSTKLEYGNMGVAGGWLLGPDRPNSKLICQNLAPIPLVEESTSMRFWAGL